MNLAILLCTGGVGIDVLLSSGQHIHRAGIIGTLLSKQNIKLPTMISGSVVDGILSVLRVLLTRFSGPVKVAERSPILVWPI